MLGRRIAAAIVLAAVTVGGVSGCGSDAPPAERPDYRFVIPAGAGEALDRGEPLNVFPPVLDVHVGEVMQIVNQDSRGHNVGPYYVGPGETATQHFTTPGELVGACTVNVSGELTVRITN